MDKKTALRFLIKHSSILEEEDKKRALDKVDTLPEADIDKLGKFLALQKKYVIEHGEEIQKKLETAIADLNKQIQSGAIK